MSSNCYYCGGHPDEVADLRRRRDELEFEVERLRRDQQMIRSVGSEPAISDEKDIRWAVNVLLEKVASKFEAWETMDLWRSEAAATVRSFKHNLESPVTNGVRS